MEVTIRRAEEQDVPQMLALVKELAAFEKAPDSVTETVDGMREAGFGKDPVWWGWVAGSPTPGEPLVGIAMCYERYSTWRGRVAYLEDIIVTHSSRGKGIGEDLFKACAAHAIENGYHHMTWQVLDWNERAIRFYERLGAEMDATWVNGRMERAQLQQLIAP